MQPAPVPALPDLTPSEKVARRARLQARLGQGIRAAEAVTRSLANHRRCKYFLSTRIAQMKASELVGQKPFPNVPLWEFRSASRFAPVCSHHYQVVPELYIQPSDLPVMISDKEELEYVLRFGQSHVLHLAANAADAAAADADAAASREQVLALIARSSPATIAAAHALIVAAPSISRPPSAADSGIIQDVPSPLSTITLSSDDSDSDIE